MLLRRNLLLLFVPLLAIAVAACEAVEAPRVDPDPVATPDLTPEDVDLHQLEREIEDRINDVRQEHGRERLQPNDELAAVAREYSCRMADEGFFAHESPDGDSVDDRITRAGIGFRVVGENLAQMAGVANPGERAVEGWMESDGHRENLLREEYTETGVGACERDGEFLFTQIFLLPP